MRHVSQMVLPCSRYFFLMAALCFFPGREVHAQGVLEAYDIRGKIWELRMQVRSVVSTIADTPGALEACELRDSPPEISAAKVDGHCRVTLQIRNGGGHLYFDLLPTAEGFQTTCISDLPPRFLPNDCESTVCAANPELCVENGPLILTTQQAAIALGARASFTDALAQLDSDVGGVDPQVRALVVELQRARTEQPEAKLLEAPPELPQDLGTLSLGGALDAAAPEMLDSRFDGRQRLRVLGRSWIQARLKLPAIASLEISTELMGARAMDIGMEAALAAAFAPDLSAGVADGLRSQDRCTSCARVADVLDLLVGAARGELAVVHARVARVRTELPVLLAEAKLPPELSEVVPVALDLLELATAGKVRELLDRASPDVLNCSGILAKAQEYCLPARLALARIALDAGLIEHAMPLLAQTPEDTSAEGRLKRAMHALLIADLALLERDLPTAEHALQRAIAEHKLVTEMTKLDASLNAKHLSVPLEAQLPVDLLSLRLNVAHGRVREGQANLQKLRAVSRNLAPTSRRMFERELTVASHLLVPAEATLQRLYGAQAAELEALSIAARGGDREFVRTQLNLRAALRDRYLSLSQYQKLPSAQLAWQESAWFKGVDERLVESGVRRAALFNPSPAEVASQLPDDALILDFAVYASLELPGQTPGHRHLLVTALGNDGLPALVDLGPYAPVQRAVSELRAAVQRADSTATNTATTRLRQLLLQPLDKRLKAARHVVVIPDADLFLLPFELLRGPAGFAPDTRVDVAASMYEAFAAQSSAISDGRVHILAAPDFGSPNAGADTAQALQFDPLPGAASEGRQLGELWGVTTAELKMGEQATEAALRAAFRPRVLHLATHGYALQNADARVAASGPNRGLKIVPATPVARPATQRVSGSSDIGSRVVSRLFDRYDNPLARVGIALASANSRKAGSSELDGIVDGHEVAALKLDGTDLVVLSACETAVGSTLDGAAVGSLQRAFHQAGARQVLATLWPIDDDASAVFMVQFHQALKDGKSARQALVIARESVRKDRRWSAPFYWAAFQLSGPVLEPGESK